MSTDAERRQQQQAQAEQPWWRRGRRTRPTGQPEELQQPGEVLVPLADGMIACGVCGQATWGPVVEQVEPLYEVPDGETPPPRSGPVQREGDVVVYRGRDPVPLGRCDGCTERGAWAKALAREHPWLVRRHGTVVAEWAEGVADALDMLGLPPGPDPGPGIVSREQVGRLLDPERALWTLGWSARFARPSIARPGVAAVAPWAAVPAKVRQELQNAHARMLRDRVRDREVARRPPVELRPPDFRTGEVPPGAVELTAGCLFCGLDRVTLPASVVQAEGGPEAVARRVWRPLTTTPESLGGARSPARVSGHVCAACAEALDKIGAVGPTVLVRALLDHLRSAGRAEQAERLATLALEPGGTALRSGARVGVVGWGGLAADVARRGEPSPPPNETPWQHVTLAG